MLKACFMFLHPLTRPFAGVIRTHYLRQKSTMSAAILPTCLIKKNISDGEAAKETKKHCDNLRTQKWSHDSVVTHDAITTHHNLIYEGSTGLICLQHTPRMLIQEYIVVYDMSFYYIVSRYTYFYKNYIVVCNWIAWFLPFYSDRGSTLHQSKAKRSLALL